ncbi:CHA4 activatory protein [Aspergillus piperis CBS 112811]|uniref:CHA4 activatory protein n=1 Tax=Aspergillus piperis CBS 112811 TaxID=1448313 RepID=A0A8G1QVU3_9EURO|nr:CHA4 activatory protein [Aspergillus piperis CBS 112811]RAH53130.1 CHA4 activatory protein [Aspergillus piperis CBS 112811]
MDSRSRLSGRKYNFACLACRQRKVKCDGRKPTCKNCARSNSSCYYKNDSTAALHMAGELHTKEARIRELEDRVRELTATETGAHDSRPASSSSQPQPQPDMPALTAPTQTTTTGPVALSVLPLPVPPEAHTEPADQERYEGDNIIITNTDGKQYFGATSRFRGLSDHKEVHDGQTQKKESEVRATELYHRRWLSSNARFQASWERTAYENIPRYTDVDPTICINLLEVYWAWQAPLHNCVYRRCFFRDMALGGPYFSTFLLNVILAHACRHLPENDLRFASFERGEFFLREALHLLVREMRQSKPRIPTIQGLLILGGRQCAVGNSSEGWLYTGMAIRMLTDLGLHIKRSYADLTKSMEPDDLEVRKRLLLSCYAWDKSISLCLGRSPSLTDMPFSPSTLFDLSDDDDLWQPPHLLETGKIYPATKCHSTLTFINFCKLAKIINETYNVIYNGPVGNVEMSVISDLENKLMAFRQELPAALQIEDPTSLQSCVPPHILCLNILCHTVLILLYRPFFVWLWHPNLQNNPLALRAQVVCTEQAMRVNELFRAYGRLFNFEFQSYLISYCVYTAATIDVRLAQHNNKRLAHMAIDRLAVTLHMLETEVKQTPGMRRSIEIIHSHIGQRWSLKEQMQQPQASSSTNGQEQLPICLLEKGGPVGERGGGEGGGRSQPFSKSQFDESALDHAMSPGSSFVSSGTSLHGSAADKTVPESLSSLNISYGQQQGPILDPNLDLESMWVDWQMDDVGGGFVPEMAYDTPYSQPFS